MAEGGTTTKEKEAEEAGAGSALPTAAKDAGPAERGEGEGEPRGTFPLLLSLVYYRLAEYTLSLCTPLYGWCRGEEEEK